MQINFKILIQVTAVDKPVAIAQRGRNISLIDLVVDELIISHKVQCIGIDIDERVHTYLNRLIELYKA